MFFLFVYSLQFTFFVPGESVSGNAYFKFSKPIPFDSLHFEVIGTLSLKHLHCADPKKAKLPPADTMVDKVFRGAGFSYKARTGDDKARSLSIPFSFTIAPDAIPSFSWKAQESKPESVCGGEVFVFFLFLFLKLIFCAS